MSTNSEDSELLDWLDKHRTGNFEDPYWKVWANGKGTLREAIAQAREIEATYERTNPTREENQTC